MHVLRVHYFFLDIIFKFIFYIIKLYFSNSEIYLKNDIMREKNLKNKKIKN